MITGKRNIITRLRTQPAFPSETLDFVERERERERELVRRRGGSLSAGEAEEREEARGE
jgi:hypothetical protein